MAIFTLAATALLTAVGIVGASTFVTGIVATGLAIVATVGLNYVAQALSGTEEEKPADKVGVQGSEGTLQAGGAVPRSFGVGYHATAGSLTYANYWGMAGETPNAYLTQVIALSDLPRESLLEVWVSGEKCTLVPARATSMGTPLAEYYKADTEGGAVKDHLWIKYYDGTQTTADGFLTSQVSSGDRPYGSNRIGKGICYAICTSLVADELFVGFPTFRFGLSGIPLYDPSKDSTNGGSGSHVWSNPATWGGDGDQLPAVQAYNILRGIRYNGAWMYGLQNMSGPARLPASNWIAQIAKCRATVTGEAGAEPAYRSGGVINIDASPANAIEALLTACQGRLSEIGGFYKIHLGEPDSPTFTWSDADLLSSEEQVFRPFFGLADSVNGIQGTYPDPAQAWEISTAPALYRSDLEIRDGQRRLMANPQFGFVPYRGQVQRLQKSGLEEAQRARTHTLMFPPAYWVVEPGDVGSWNSTRNGYIDKLFRVDSVVDRANLDCALSVTEVDPADYDWNQAVDFTPVGTAPTMFPRPAPQGVVDWTAEGALLYDELGIGRHAAIRIHWDNTLPGLVGMQYEVRLSADLSSVTRGRTDQYSAGALVISQGIIPLTHYQVRGQYIPTAPREMLWSDWIEVMTPEIASSIVDIPVWITNQVTAVFDQFTDRLIEFEQRQATLTAKFGAQDYEETRSVRSQLTSTHGAAMAEISRVENVSTSADEALAESITTIEATIGPGFGTDPDNTISAKVEDASTAHVDGDTALAQQIETIEATIGPGFGTTADTTISAKVTDNATAIVEGDAALASQIDTVETSITTINDTIGPGFNTTTNTISAVVTSVATSVTTGDSALASDIDSVEASITTINNTIGPGFDTGTNTISAKVTTNATAITTLNGYAAANYSVELDVNGYATGFQLINGGAAAGSSTVFYTSRFAIAEPGDPNGGVRPVFAVSQVDGAWKVAFRGDMYADGTIFGRSMVADTVTAREIAASTITATEIAASTITGDKIAANTINADRLITGTITSDSGKIGSLSLKSLSIADQAATVPVMETRGDVVGAIGGWGDVSSVTLNFDTVGLAGKTLSILASFTGQVTYNGVWGNPGVRIFIDGSLIQTISTSQSWDWFFSLAGSKTFTANGGAESHTVVVQWFGNVNSGTTSFLNARTLWAMVGKR